MGVRATISRGLDRLSFLLITALVGLAALMRPAVADVAEPATVGIVYRSHATYRQTADALNQVLQERRHKCIMVELKDERLEPETDDEAEPSETAPSEETGEAGETGAFAEALKPLAEARPDVIVTVGSKATSLVLKAVPETSVVFCMVPNAADASFMARGNPDFDRVCGVTTDIAPSAQLEWINRLSPKVRRLGVLTSRNSKKTVEAIVNAAAKIRGIEVVPIDATKDAFPDAVKTLNDKECDAVLMIADAAVYNAANVRRLLLWGLRQKRPVWTFSENLVKAGAFAALYIDERDVARQTADVVQDIIRGRKIPEDHLYHPSRFKSAVNERTAEMIGIPLSRQDLEQVTRRYDQDK